MLGPSSLPRCSVELFKASLDLAARRGVGLHTHLLSAKSQVPVAGARYGGSTVEFLREIGGLRSGASFAHPVSPGGKEIGVLAGAGAGGGPHPASNPKPGAGAPPAPPLLPAGVPAA